MNEIQTQIYGLHSTQSSGVNNKIQTESLSQKIWGIVHPFALHKIKTDELIKWMCFAQAACNTGYSLISV